MLIASRDELPEHLLQYFEPIPKEIEMEASGSYVKHIVQVFHEIKRVLKKTGCLYLNLGDTYSGGGGNSKQYNRGPNSTFSQNTGNLFPEESVTKETSLPPKCLIGIPERIMLGLIDDGWILRNKVIWYKPGHMPSSVKDRFSNGWEAIYFFVKQGRYWFDLDAVRVPHSEGYLSENRPAGILRQKLYPNSQERYSSTEDPHLAQFIGEPKIESTTGEITANPLGKNCGDYWEYEVPDSSLLWLAGIIDAEGAIYASHKGQTETHPYVEIVNTDSRLMRVVQSIIRRILKKDINIKERDLSNQGHRNIWRISLYGESASKVCEAVMPYLLTKRQRAKLAIELQELQAHRVPFQETDESVLSNRERIWERMRVLNEFGEELNEEPDTWTVNTQPFPEAHFATFPEKLVERPIKASCPKDGIVLDPFAGSGTVALVAKNLGRSSISIEIKPEYCEMIKLRIDFGHETIDRAIEWIYETS